MELKNYILNNEHLKKGKDKIENLWANGINFTYEEVSLAKNKNKLLLLDMDFTSECDLYCYYCDRTVDRFNKLKSEKKQLDTEKRKKLILEAKNLGARTIEFPGSGEPMLDEGFWEIIEYVNQNNMTPVIFTSGWHLNDEYIDRLYNMNATIFLKYNSSNPEINDDITNVPGYGLHLNKILNKLLKKGFSKSIPTRLAIDMVLTPRNENMEEVKNIFRWCRKNNIHTYISTLIPEGIADNKTKLFERQKAISFIDFLAKIDKEEFNLEYEPILPMAGGYRCRQSNIGLFVNLYGEVYDCNGLARFLGNIYINSLEDIWKSKFATSLRQKEQNGYCIVRERVWENTSLKGIDRKLEEYYNWEKQNGIDPIFKNGLKIKQIK